MIRIFLFILSTLLFFNCSGQKFVEKLNTKEKISTADSLNRAEKAQSYFVNGTLLELKGNFAEAIIEYQSALELDNSPGIHYALGKNYLRLNKLSQAFKHSKAAVKLDSINMDFNFLLANIYAVSRQQDSAAIIYEKVIALDSSNVQAYFNLATLFEANKPLKALEVYRKLLELTGPEWNVLIRIADINERLGKVVETISTVEELLNLDPSNIQLRKLLIESYLKTDNYDKALSLIEDAMLIFPNDLNLVEYKANVHLNKKEWAKAAKEYSTLINDVTIPYENKLRIAQTFVAFSSRDSSVVPYAKLVLEEISKDSSNWQVEAFLGEIASLENQDSLAINHFYKAVGLAEWNAHVWNKLGILLFENRRYEEALNEMDKAVKRFPDDFVINIILGLSLSQQNKHSYAEPILQKAIQLNPNDLTALHAYGFTLNQLSRNKEAIIYLERALEIDSNNIQVMGTLGLIYDSLQDWEKCDSLYESALRVDSTNALILNNYAYSLAERDISLERALQMAEAAINADPENSSYLDTIGWIYFKLAVYDKALEYILRAIEKDSENATLADHLGDVYFHLGEKDKAIECWQKAVDLDASLTKVKQKILQANS